MSGEGGAYIWEGLFSKGLIRILQYLIQSLRLAKEETMYKKEVVDQSAKIEKMKADGKDEHDIKKQVC